LSNDSIAESGSPKFNCALPSVTQACIKIIRCRPYHSWRQGLSNANTK
jgi:hypothetical protein